MTEEYVTVRRSLITALESEVIEARRKQCVDCDDWEPGQTHEYLTKGFCFVKGRETMAEDGCQKAKEASA